MNIQNHFSDTALLSLAELKTRLEQDCKLDARKQREMISAINTTAKWLNLPAEMIPASATFLRGKFEDIHPARHHVTKRRVQNIKSLILSAMRSQGLSTKHVSHLQIIDQKIWDKAQAIKAKYASLSGNKRQTRKRLLTGLVRCNCCGGGMTIIGRERYACSARREQGTCTNGMSIKAQDLESRVFQGLQTILLGREEAVKAFADAFHAEVKRLQTNQASNKAAVQKDLVKVETGIKRCVDLLLYSDTPMDSIRATLEDLEAQKRKLTHQLKLQTEEDKIALHPNIGELYSRKVEDLQALLKNEATKLQASEVIRSLIQKIVVSPTSKRGKCDVVLYGALASILQYACAPDEGGTTSSNVGRVLLVAGVGFEPTTFRL